MTTLTVTSDLERLGAGAGRAEQIVQRELGRLVQAIAYDVEAEAKRQAPVATGNLRRSITTGNLAVGGGRATLDVGPGALYGRFVEFGRAPGRMPPIAAVTGWAARRGIPAFVLARAIARRGTRARPYMRPGLAYARSRAPRHINPAAKRITAALGGGR